MRKGKNMKYHFGEKELASFSRNIRREWALTNGIGGYAGGSIIGANNRTHQGYLIASLHAPVERYLVFTKTNETIVRRGEKTSLETSQHLGHPSRYAEGQRYLTAFDYDGSVTFTYEAADLRIKKCITLAHGANLCAIAYEIENKGDDAELLITPLMSFRDHSENVTRDDLHFATRPLEHGFCLVPDRNTKVRIDLAVSEGEPVLRSQLYDENLQLQTEVDNEVDGLDTAYTPYDLRIDLPGHATKRVSLLCQAGLAETLKALTVSADDAFSYRDRQKAYVDGLIRTAGYKDEWASALVVASDQLISDRQSTGLKTVLAGLPWFTDWGRDTMIAFTGLTLSTKRYQEAADILKTFSMYVKHGMVPNMFPDDGQDPLYNTADASLWYFYAVHKYLEYVKTEEAYGFIQKEIFPSLKEILSAYEHGTDFSIAMDTDGLISCGGGNDQVTWMDVRVGNWVPTPRHGKPVEINALWYNALRIMADLCDHFGEDKSHYEALAAQAKASFCKRFWNPETGCLYDVVDSEHNHTVQGASELYLPPVGEPRFDDASIRPNQIYAVSLPYDILPPDQAIAVVNTVEEKLYAQTGLRSLSPDHKDYHPIYLGSLPKRDAAYHMGTSWGFLMGGFITAYMKVHGYNAATARQALALLSPVKTHMNEENCIGSICEIFDGDSPHKGRGCYAQAWSVGEVLRCYTEDILPYL